MLQDLKNLNKLPLISYYFVDFKYSSESGTTAIQASDMELRIPV